MMMSGQDLYAFTSKLLLGYQMDATIFYWLLNTSKGKVELMRPWVQLRTEDSSQNASPIQNTINNSMYLTPFNLPANFLNWYSPTRSIVLVSSDGLTFRWYKEIPLERKHEYKDDNSKFYINKATRQLFFCGILDQNYSVHQFYIQASPDITAVNSWVFPGNFAPILAFDVAQTYREMFDYDIVNAAQGDKIEKGFNKIFKQMTEWDGNLQESQLEGIDSYQDSGNGAAFNNRVVGDNNW